eukprot:TRINITY_DN1306_c0_g1_i2.p1 TRINITY_DN1306_c0_g1~~TRINITY_DN1306_c0_g1_i2.p1  ORF type:complete len:214 (-),score=40.04 TRINITY_DN1306_c0_g1_i2:335-976(-)
MEHQLSNPLDTILRSTHERKQFKKFLKTEECSQHYYFIQEIENFKKYEHNRKKMKKRGMRIWEKFFSEDSDFEINISGRDRILLENKVHKGEWCVDMFDKVESSVRVDLRNDSVPRFRNQHPEARKTKRNSFITSMPHPTRISRRRNMQSASFDETNVIRVSDSVKDLIMKSFNDNEQDVSSCTLELMCKKKAIFDAFRDNLKKVFESVTLIW